MYKVYNKIYLRVSPVTTVRARRCRALSLFLAPKSNEQQEATSKAVTNLAKKQQLSSQHPFTGLIEFVLKDRIVR